MYGRTTLTSAVAATAALLVAMPAAQASTLDRFDRRAFDSAPVVRATGYSMAGATAGELGGYLDLSVDVRDGTLPAPGQCESADVEAHLTVSPGESFTIRTVGELCSHVVDGSPTVNAYFGAKQVTYSGTHKRARVTDGMIASTRGFLGALGSVGLTVRW